MRRLLLLGSGAAGLLILGALAIGWTERLPLTTRLVNRRLAATGVPFAYRLTRLDPGGARLEAVRLGDPAHPDLTIDRLDLRFGYGRHGAFVAGVSARSARLGARLDGRGLSLGALDSLLPRTGQGGAILPDLALDLDDAEILLTTPNGPLALTLDGRGNPQRRFAGTVRFQADRLRLGGCAVGPVGATLRVAVAAGAPVLAGPATLSAAACPGLSLGAGRLDVRVATDPPMRRLAAQARIDRFDGRAGPVRFAGLSGTVAADGRFGALDGTAQLRLARADLPDAVRRLRALATPLAATPLGPVAARATQALAALLGNATAEAVVAGQLRGTALAVRLGQADLSGRDGARVRLRAPGLLGLDGSGWHVNADLDAGGGTLPAVRMALRQRTPGAPVTGTATLAPYAAGTARLALDPTRFRWADDSLRFAGVARVSGPVPGGRIDGLALPLDGEAHADGRVRLDEGCRILSVAGARLGTARLKPAVLRLCGAPLVARDATGHVRLDARSGPFRLAGRIGGASAGIAGRGLALMLGGFVVEGVALTLGDGPAPTRIAADRIAGGWNGGGFQGAGGTIGTVPLRLSDATGRWDVADGALHLTGALRVADTAPSPRFLPLAATDARLALADGRIAATARLAEPKSGATVAALDLTHDLTAGTGRALLAVDGLRFAPKGLQPDALTPLTLGVVANVAGTVRGEGVVAWDPAGVASHGTFGTDGLDLAAAFGPVKGLAGQLRFTDLLGLVSAPDQEVRVAEINPGVAIADGRVRFHLSGQDRLAVDEAAWPFAGGTLRLEPTVLDFGEGAERAMTFTLSGLDAARFVQQLDFPNIAATGTFDGTLPMRFGQDGGRIVGGSITARAPGGTLAYVGELSSARLGTMGKLAFDALKAIRYSALAIRLDGRLDGEMVSRVTFTGVREATAEQGLAARLIRNLPFRFNIRVEAPFRGLVGSARSYADPRLLLQAPVQPAASAPVP